MYQPIDIEVLDEGRLRGYSEVLGLYVCWEEGMLRFFDPVTESYLRSHEEAEAVRRLPRPALRKRRQPVGMAAEARAREESTARGEG